MGPTGLKVICGQGWLSSFSEAPEKNAYLLFPDSENWVRFLSDQHLSNSISYASYFKDPYHYIGLTQIIQGYQPILKLTY